jgi:signal transduction histidine kinase
MNVIRNLRLRVFDVLLLVGLGVIGWAAYEAFQEIQMTGGLWRSFSPPQPAEYFVIADHLQPAVEELNGALVRYVVRGERADWDGFQLKSQALKEWIARQKSTFAGAKVVQVQPVMLTTDLNTLLVNIERTFDDYTAAAQKAGPPASQEQKLASLEQVQMQSLRLAALGSQARAEGQTIQLFLSGSKPWFLTFRLHVSLLVMTGMLVWLMMVTYRRVVSPLRSKLIESDAIIEGQRKLATYGKHAAGVAHEIRTPLTTIKARLFTLQKTLARGTPEYRDATIIDNEINRLDRIVTDFLTLGRPAHPNLVPVSADALLRDVSELFRPQCEKQSIQLRLDAVVDAPFLADTRQLKQVLINLVRNATESIGKGGTIRLRARRDTWRLNKQLTKVVILEVQDTGPGISPAVQQRLFDPFFTTKERGTGLGLSISAAIIRTHGGKLVVHLHPGQGATVSIVLPYQTSTL